MNLTQILKRLDKFFSSPPVGRINVKVKDVNQLFNSMDPSPFTEKDLDDDANTFIESWAFEYSAKTPLTLSIHIDQPLPPEKSETEIAKAIHHFFTHKASLKTREFKQLLRDGRISLLIGLFFLSICVLVNGVLVTIESSPMSNFSRESLIIAGWVAMWRPIQIYLYEWWPIMRKAKIYTKMGKMKIIISISKAKPTEKKQTP